MRLLTKFSIFQSQTTQCRLRNYSNVKVGFTNNPESRITKHKLDTIGWDRMIVIYETSSINFVKKIETILIENNWDYVENIISGGGGRTGEGYQYIYVLLKE